MPRYDRNGAIAPQAVDGSGDRFGVESRHPPDVVEVLNSLSAATRDRVFSPFLLRKIANGGNDARRGDPAWSFAMNTCNSVRASVDGAMQDIVDILREREVSWATIGQALAVSRQAAWKRFG